MTDLMNDIIISKSYDELYRLAFIDTLTGVYSRNTLEELRKILDTRAMYVTFVDVDGLKGLNDNFGHRVGDEAIKYVADQLKSISDYVFRLGGDEFLVLHEEPIDISFTKSSYGTVKKTADMTLSKAMCIADKLMYKDKKRRNKGKMSTKF